MIGQQHFNRPLSLVFLVLGTVGSAFGQSFGNFNWLPSGSNSIGAVSSILIVSGVPTASSSTILAGTMEKGVYFSTDGGATWNQSTLNGGWVNCLAQLEPSIIFAGTNTTGLWLSKDGGATWSQTVLSDIQVQCVAAAGGFVFVGTYNSGLFVSSDSGGTWKSANDSLPTYNDGKLPDVTALAFEGGTILAGTNAGVYFSTDHGTHWLHEGMDNKYITALSTQPYGSGGWKVYAGSYDGVYTAANTDSTWTSWNAGLTDSTIWAIEAAGPNFYAATDSGIFVSTGNNSSWTPINLGVTNPSGTCLSVSGDTAVAGTGGSGIFLTTNGSSWKAINSNISGTAVAELLPSGSRLYAATSGGVYFSPDTGKTWTPISNGITNDAVTSVAVNGTSIFAGTTLGMFISHDAGETWSIIDSLANKSFTSVVSSGNYIFAGSSAGLYRSTDAGTTWSLSDSGLTSLSVTSLIQTDSGVFAGTNGGGVFVSTDNGQIWNSVNSSLTNPNVTCLMSYGQNLYVGTSGGPYISALSASSPIWTPIVQGFPNKTAAGALVASGSILFAGTPTGVYISFNDGNNWEAFTSFPGAYAYAPVGAMAVFGTELFASLTSGGILQGSLNDITSVRQPGPTVPIGYSLSQNFPNPFNPTTTISYDLKAAGQVTLRIYDVLGRQVETLVDGWQKSGTYRVVFNGSRFASGVYFYRLAAGSFSKTMKMVLVK